MPDWREAILGDLADLTVGHVGPMASEYQAAGIPFLRSQNVAPHRFDMSEVKFIGQRFHERLPKSSLQPGDVVTVRTGQPGATAVVPSTWGSANCADLVITRPGPELDSRWLSYYLNSAAAEFVSSQLVGAVQQHFNVGSAKSLRLLLPPIPEQRAIADVLGVLDDKIAANATLIATADDLVRTKFQRLDRLTAERLPLHRIVDLHKAHVQPTELDPATPYVGLEHIPRRLMWLDQQGTARQVTSAKVHFKEHDILFGKLRPYFHKVVSAPFEGVCSTDILVLRAVDSQLDGFALASLSSDSVVQASSAAGAGTRMPRTNWRDLGTIETVWPGTERARALSEQVKRLRDLCNEHLRESAVLAATRDALLPPLMSGRLQVRDAEKIVGERV